MVKQNSCNHFSHFWRELIPKILPLDGQEVDFLIRLIY